MPSLRSRGAQTKAWLSLSILKSRKTSMLDARFWQVENGASGALREAIEAALVNGWSASKAAGKFMYEGSANKVVQPNIDLSGYSDGHDRVNEVFCSEINRAHGEAFMAVGEGTSGFAGWRYLLSQRHPKPDICDLLSTQNLHGLGDGVYPDRASTPWPAHPNTLSFVEMVFKDELTPADAAGKETSILALIAKPPDAVGPELRALVRHIFEKNTKQVLHSFG